MFDLPDDALLREIEARAAEMARGAGAVLSSYFGKSLDVEFKDEAGHDPVTNADKETQEFLGQAIGKHFPDHSILGEEDEPKEDSPANDFVWALDPLDLQPPTAWQNRALSSFSIRSVAGGSAGTKVRIPVRQFGLLRRSISPALFRSRARPWRRPVESRKARRVPVRKWQWFPRPSG